MMGLNRFSQTSPPLTTLDLYMDRKKGGNQAYLDLHAVCVLVLQSVAFQVDDFIIILITPIPCAHLCCIIHEVINSIYSVSPYLIPRSPIKLYTFLIGLHVDDGCSVLLARLVLKHIVESMYQKSQINVLR